MIDLTPSQIRATLAAGIISEEQANGLLKRAGVDITSADNVSVIGNEDEMRFFQSFSDIFIAVGLGLLLIGLVVVTGFFPFSSLMGIFVMWALAEYFGRHKRQQLPTLVTAIGYFGFVYAALNAASLSDGITLIGYVLAIFAMLFYYWRIRLPFGLAMIAASAFIAGLFFLGSILDVTEDRVVAIYVLIAGLIILWVAMQYDLSLIHI